MKWQENVRRYVCINTTEHNDDGEYRVEVLPYLELSEWGFDEDEMKAINAMGVGDVDKDFCFNGVIVIRVA